MPALSIAENIALGDLPVRRRRPARVVDRAACARKRALCSASSISSPIPTGRSQSLSFAERQLVAIAKALRLQCRIFILDEPTAALEKREIERLFARARRA